MANTTNFAVEKPTVGGYRNSWGGTLNTGFDKLTELLALALPVGTIQMYPKATAPTATTNGGTWLICDGGSLAQVGDYAALYALIGTTYGTGSSVSGTFSLPDLRSRVPVGYSVDGASTSGRSNRLIAAVSGTETHTLLDAEIPKHTHPITDSGHDHDTTEVAHTHTGETAKAKADIVLNDHSHTYLRRTDHLGVGPPVTASQAQYLVVSLPSTDGNTELFTGVALLDEDGASNLGHKHSIAGTNLGTTATDLTIDDEVTGITVNDQATGDTAHNIMQPYLVVNYIILAKHPTF